MNKERFSSRKIYIGGKEIQRSPEAAFAANIAGVDIYTDCLEISNILSLMGAPEAEGVLSLTYLTQAGFESLGVRELHPMDESAMGDLYVEDNLRNFAFVGFNKFGTLASLAYGIRSFHNIQHGLLGLHSAALLERATNSVYLIVGESGAGKSTVASMLAEHHNEKLKLLCDDWVEVYVDNLMVSPISVAASKDIASTSSKKNKFVSFNKTFVPSSSIERFAPLSGMIEIVADSNLNGPDELRIRQMLGHVPFIDMPVIDSPFKTTAERNIKQRLKWILSDYTKIRSLTRSKRVVNQRGVTQLEELEHNILNFVIMNNNE